MRPLDYKDFCIRALRRASYRWPMRSQAMTNARVSRGLYKCASCATFCKVREIALDHIHPVVPVTGWDSLDKFAERLLCSVEGWQVLCKPCHKIKTLAENVERKEHRKEKKNVSKREALSTRQHPRHRHICTRNPRRNRGV